MQAAWRLLAETTPVRGLDRGRMRSGGSDVLLTIQIVALLAA